MTQIFAIMIIFFIMLSIFYMIKIRNIANRMTKSKELSKKENPLEKDYQFIKGLY